MWKSTKFLAMASLSLIVAGCSANIGSVSVDSNKDSKQSDSDEDSKKKKSGTLKEDESAACELDTQLESMAFSTISSFGPGATSFTVTPSDGMDGLSSVEIDLGSHFLEENICNGKTVFGRGGVAICQENVPAEGVELIAENTCEGQFFFDSSGVARAGVKDCSDPISELQIGQSSIDLNGLDPDEGIAYMMKPPQPFVYNENIQRWVPQGYEDATVIENASGDEMRIDVAAGDDAATVDARGWTRGGSNFTWQDGADHLIMRSSSLNLHTLVFSGVAKENTDRMCIIARIKMTHTGSNQYGRWNAGFFLNNSQCAWDCHPKPAYHSMHSMEGTVNTNALQSRSGASMYVRSQGYHSENTDPENTDNYLCFEPDRVIFHPGHRLYDRLTTLPDDYTYDGNRTINLRAYDGVGYEIYSILGIEK